MQKTIITIMLSSIALAGCATIEPMGKVGPNKVYSISNNSFLSSSQMIVVLNKKGDVAAYSGGTTSGAGTIALETGASVLTAGAVAYAGRSIEHGLETTHVRASGIPSTFHIKGGLDNR